MPTTKILTMITNKFLQHFLTWSIPGLLLISCSSPDPKQEQAARDLQESRRYDLALKDKIDLFEALPESAENPENPSSAAKIKLGHALYYDTKLSGNNTISCNSCHNLAKGGADVTPFSAGDKGQLGGRNSPSVLNAALHKFQFWDGRAKDVEEQAGMPILNPGEMAIPSEKALCDKLSKEANYKALFAEAFPGEANPITYPNIRKAIAAFERQLLTPSAVDKYLKGDSTALTVQEKRGMLAFATVGCATCHNGALLGGNSFQKFGVHKPYWEETKSEKHDEGRFEVTKAESDKFMFKVPALRNVGQTAPYFHDGSVKDLDKAVEIMAKVQLNYTLNDSEKENIVAFLKALDGSVPVAFQSAPKN